jgi:outer membrane protein
LFNGFQTANKTRQAEAQVLAARATLRNTEQTVLLNAATAYMNLLRDTAILGLQKSNVEVLQEQLRQTRDRFNVGEVTRTDVAQSESRLAAGRSQELLAQANYTASAATYRQVIGSNPGKLAPGTSVDRFSPHALPAAISLGIATNPSVVSAQFNVDVAEDAVKVAESALYPTLSVQGSFTKNWLSTQSLSIMESYNASVLGTLSVPIYQGGAEYSAIRQAKETLGQRRLDLDVTRDTVRQNVVQSWGQLDAAKANIEATRAQVQAAEIALNGVREEARVGQRTTLDVLNAQQELVNARVALVSAQRDRVVASYALLAAVGRCRRRCSACTCRPTTCACITGRCAIAGPACAIRTGGSPCSEKKSRNRVAAIQFENAPALPNRHLSTRIRTAVMSAISGSTRHCESRPPIKTSYDTRHIYRYTQHNYYIVGATTK